MSQELVGSCGAVLGSSDYFQKINQGAIFTPFMTSQDGYYYSFAVGQLCSRCAAVIDEICSDLRNSASSLSRIPGDHRDNLEKLIANLEEASSFMSPAFTSAGECRALLTMAEVGGNNGEILSIWGVDIGSRSYMQSKCAPIFSSIFADPLASISQTIISDLSSVAEQIAADIDLGADQHYYVKDENGESLRKAIQELERCNCNALSFHGARLNSLCWYQNISSSSVLALQKALNKIPGFVTLTEDGVYGEKTSNAYNELMNELVRGSVPSLILINPLQTSRTGIDVGIKATKGGQTFSRLMMDGSNAPLFRADLHPFQGNPSYYHINVSAPNSAPAWQKNLAGSLDHMEISEEAYQLLKNFDDTAKVIKIGGRILLAAGIMIDALTLAEAIHSDLNDADQKLGKTTVQTSASIVGSWSGSFIGAKAGAMAGAGIGTVILPGLGTAVGGIAGGLILGVVGAIGGSAFGEWLVDISGVWG